MEDLIIQYQGFSPSPIERSLIDNLIQRLHDESPSTSTVRAHISKAGDSFKGSIRVTSHAGRFFAIASGADLTEVGHQLLTRMRKHLSRWKKRRFSGENLRDAALWSVRRNRRQWRRSARFMEAPHEEQTS